MKTKIVSVVCMFCGIYLVGAQAEYDDMYFTSKDRSTQLVTAKVEKQQSSLNALTETNAAYQAVLPSGKFQGYSGRTINPDYQPGGVAVVTSSYFTPNYQPASVNRQLYSSNNNNYNNFNNYYRPYSYYGMGGYYSPYSSFGYSPYGYGGYNSFGYSPYSSYGGFYDPFYSSWGYSPYYGYGSSMSMYYGLAYGFGSGFGYGYGSGFGGCGSYYGYYPNTVVVVNNPDNHVNTSYGKRQTRSSYTNASGNSAARGVAVNSIDPNQNRGGRVASTTNSNSYYQRGWRQDPSITQSTSTSSSSRYSGYSGGSSNSTRSSWSSTGSNSTRSAWGNNTNNSGFSNGGFSGNTRSNMSSGSSFSGGGSRSSVGSGGSVSHSSSGGRRGN